MPIGLERDWLRLFRSDSGLDRKILYLRMVEKLLIVRTKYILYLYEKSKVELLIINSGTLYLTSIGAMKILNRI
jgi:hypothetical protein